MSSLEKHEFSTLTQKYNKVELKYYEILCSAISLFKLSWVMHQHDDPITEPTSDYITTILIFGKVQT